MKKYRTISISTFCGVLCASIWLAGLCYAEDPPVANDEHDKLVYSRYDRGVAIGVIQYNDEMKHIVLSRPATKQDVVNGTAVFTLEGLGKRRVWKLPESPGIATWVGLEQFPHRQSDGTTRYDTFGIVVQAEELLVDGKWKRYFGFVCRNGVGVVPANRVDLWLPSDMAPPGTWKDVPLPGGIGWHCAGPYEIHDGKRTKWEISGGQPLLVDVYLSNRRGVPIRIPTDLYRDRSANGPAFVKGLDVSVGFAPFKARTADREYPRIEDFSQLPMKRRAAFAPTAEGRLCKTGKWFKAFTIDLGDWFEIKEGGHYLFRFKFDAAAMGLPTEQTSGFIAAYWCFHLGSPPRRLTAKEMNTDIPRFGGRVTEKELRDLIVTTVKPSHAQSKSPGGNSTNEAASLLPAKKLPAFGRTPFHGGNLSLDETTIQEIFIANWDRIATLADYEPIGLLAELERRMAAEKNPDMKFLLATLAASRGSTSAALVLLDGMKTADYVATRRVHIALLYTLHEFDVNHPDWIVQLILAALADQRYVTDTDNGSDELLTISYHADEDANLTLALGNAKCVRTVPFLIQMCRDTNGSRGPVMALGSIGDRRAIPVLIECLKRAGKTVKHPKSVGLSDEFIRPVNALASLKARQAVPELLKHIEFPDVIDALATLGDPQAVEPLKAIVANRGRLTRDGKDVYPDLAPARLVSAKITLACLDKKNAIPRLCALLADPSFGKFQRREVVWRLGDRPDPRSIPFLIKAIKTDRSGSVVNQAITVLSVFKYGAAVEGLIECLDADFEGKADWKRAYKPKMFRENIAGSLQKITGHKIGPDKQKWLDWWRENHPLFE